MPEIKRYTTRYPQSFCLIFHKLGGWVRYSDHLAALATNAVRVKPCGGTGDHDTLTEQERNEYEALLADHMVDKHAMSPESAERLEELEALNHEVWCADCIAAIRKQERERVLKALETAGAVERFNAALPGVVRHSTVDTIMAFRAALAALEDSE